MDMNEDHVADIHKMNQQHNSHNNIIMDEERVEKYDLMDDDEVEELLCRPRPTSHHLADRYMLQAPEFVVRLNAFEEVTAGSTVVFGCQWSSLPKPTIKWYKDDQEITEDQRYKGQSDEDGDEKLVIENTQRADEGTYKCKAENQEGVASTTGYLSVTGDVKDKPLASQPRRSPSEHSVSHPPFLRSIQEQKSMEEREEVEYSHLPPSPLTEYIDTIRKEHSWPFARSGGFSPQPPGEDDAESSDSDTSVESQGDYERESLNLDGEADEFEEDIINVTMVTQANKPPPAYVTNGMDDITNAAQENKPPPSYEEVQALRRLQAAIEESTASELGDDVTNGMDNISNGIDDVTNDSPPPGPDHNDDGLLINDVLADSLKSQSKDILLAQNNKQPCLETPQALEICENRVDVINPDSDSTKVTNITKYILCDASELETKSHNMDKETTSSESLQNAISERLMDLFESAVQPPIIYYIYFVLVCTFLGSGLEIYPPLYVLMVAILALISFRIFFHPRSKLKKPKLDF